MTPDVLLRFSRPHTMLGTALCTGALCGGSRVFAYALPATLATNLYITGVNQISDVKIDAINKPNLPLPSGDMTMMEAHKVVAFALGTSIVFSTLSRSAWLSATTAVSSVVGTFYSLPPQRWKRNPWSAAACIVAIRGVVANLGLGLAAGRSVRSVVPLVVYFSLLSVSIAVLKDVPDVIGDGLYGGDTFAIRHGRATATSVATFALSAATALASFSAVHTIRICTGLALVYFLPLALHVFYSVDTTAAKLLYARLWAVFYASYAALWSLG